MMAAASATARPSKRKAPTRSDDALLTINSHSRLTVPAGVPWLANIDRDVLHQNVSVIARLGQEIKAFDLALLPDPEDVERRQGFIQCINRRLERYFNGCQVLATGSTATGLFLPGGDIDLTVTWDQAANWFGPEDAADSFLALTKAILDTDPDHGQITYRRWAGVPIVCLKGSYGSYDADISYDRTEELKAVPLIHKMLALVPFARPLILILKLFLEANKLNKPYQGGIGGFATVVIVWWYLQVHPRVVDSTVDLSDPSNWGTFLIDLFDYLGDVFDYKRHGMSLRGGGTYVKREDGTAELFVEDPYNPDNNLAKGCRVGALQAAFRQGRMALCDAVRYQVAELAREPCASWGQYLERVGHSNGSILHSVIGLDDEKLSCTKRASHAYPVSALRDHLQLATPPPF